MKGYEPKPSDYNEIQPPEIVALENDHWLYLLPIGSHLIDVSNLRRPLDIVDDSAHMVIPEQERAWRDAYIADCEERLDVVWHEIEMFIATTSIDHWSELNEEAVSDTRLAFKELIQNAFHYGTRPQRLSVNLVTVSEHFSPQDPINTSSNSIIKYVSPRVTTGTGNHILLGVQDRNPHVGPNWYIPARKHKDDIPEKLRGLDIVHAVTNWLWHQSDGKSAKWIWALV